MSKKKVKPLGSDIAKKTRNLVTVSILTEGTLLRSSIELSEIQIVSKANQVPIAFVEIKNNDLTLCDDPAFLLGSDLEIKAGHHSDEAEVFCGKIIAHNLISRKRENFLRIEVKHNAFVLESGEKSRVFQDTSDAEAVHEIISGVPKLSFDISNLNMRYESLIQAGCSDWHFVTQRAEANGCLVHCFSNQISFVPLKTPSSSNFRISSIEALKYDLRLNAQSQFEQINSKVWDSATQEVTSHSRQNNDDLSLELAGDLGNGETDLCNLGYTRSTELDSRLDSMVNEMPLLAITGKIEINGTAEIQVGSAIQLVDFGSKLSKKVLVTGVMHLIKKGKWRTTLTIGLSETSTPTGQNKSNVGLQIGLVSKLAGDPLKQHRIEVHLPMMGDKSTSVWARPCIPDAGDMRGFHFRPEIGDEVIVSFLGGETQEPLILGSLHSSAHPSAFEDSDDNHFKGIITKSNLKLEFDDDQKVINLQTPGGNRISVSEEEYILIEDSLGNKIKTDSEGITITSIKDLKLDANGEIRLTGVDIIADGSSSVGLKGGASAELSSGGSTKVEGSIVQIN